MDRRARGPRRVQSRRPRARAAAGWLVAARRPSDPARARGGAPDTVVRQARPEAERRLAPCAALGQFRMSRTRRVCGRRACFFEIATWVAAGCSAAATVRYGRVLSACAPRVQLIASCDVCCVVTIVYEYVLSFPTRPTHSRPRAAFRLYFRHMLRALTCSLANRDRAGGAGPVQAG